MSQNYALSDTLSSIVPLAATLTARPDDLPGATLEGGAGDDTLSLLDGGIFDLTLADVFTGIETVRGSNQHDRIILDQDQFAGIKAFDGGDEPEIHWDELVLEGTAFDFTTKTLVNIDQLSLTTDNVVLTVADLETAMRASGIASQHDKLVASSVAFTDAQLKALYRQGIDTVVDALGTHENVAPVTTNLNDDTIEAAAGQTLYLDIGRDALVSDDDGTFSLLSVNVPPSLAAPGHLGIDTSTGVTLGSGYAAGSSVKVGGTEVGMLWDAGDASLGIVLNANATSARVQEIVRALTYTMADTPPIFSTQQQVAITLADEGGRKSVATMTIAQHVADEPPRLDLSHASVPELAPDGTLVGLLTAKVSGAGDSFTYTLTDDAGHRFAIQGDRLVVAAGLKLDYEQNRTHNIVVHAAGKDGSAFDQAFTITIEDVQDEIIGGIGGGGSMVGTGGTGSGANGNNTLVGGAGTDRLVGGEGHDILYGKGGNDVLTGGEDADIFVFDTKPNAKKNVDRITDFNVKYDSIHLDHRIFKGLGKQGSPDHPTQLAKKMFWKGTAAHDRNDRIIYDLKKGALYYDADGTGHGVAVKLAMLPKKLKTLSEKDFFLI